MMKRKFRGFRWPLKPPVISKVTRLEDAGLEEIPRLNAKGT